MDTALFILGIVAYGGTIVGLLTWAIKRGEFDDTDRK